MLSSIPRTFVRQILQQYRRLPKEGPMTVESVLPYHPIGRGTVLHLGANDGTEAEAYARCGFKRVIWIEGFPRFYERLVKHLSAYPNQDAYNVLVSDVEGEELAFRIAENGVSSTVFQAGQRFGEDFPGVRFVEQTKLKARRLDRFFAERGVDLSDVSIAVVDLEGSELKALRSLGDLIERIPYAIVEVSVTENFVSGPALRDIDDYMTSRGFRRVQIKLGSSSGDALYERHPASVLDQAKMRASAAIYANLFYGFYRNVVVKSIKRFASG
jgi:FkbM family methyltransferase